MRSPYQCRPVIDTPSGTQQYTFFPDATTGIKPNDLADTASGRWQPVNKGITPNITIGTVTATDDPSGAAATLTGTQTDPILNLVFPRGRRGKSGIGIPGEKGETGSVAIGFGNVPTAASSAGNVGEVKVDENYLYLCIAPSTWKRVQLSTW